MVGLYCTVFQIGRYCLTYELKWGEPNRLVRDGITRENYPAAYLLPGCESLVPLHNSSLRCCRSHAIAVTQRELKAD